MMAAIAPMSQTAQTKDGARAQVKHSRTVQKMIRAIAPWTSERDGLVSKEMREKIGSGNVAVMLDSGDPGDSDVYKEAKKIKSNG